MKYFKLLILIICIPGFFYSCTDDELGDSIIDLNPSELNEIDQYIRDNYTKDYNIEVIYKWDYAGSELSKKLIPVKDILVIPTLDVIKRAWIEPYVQIGGSLFFKKLVPKQIFLIGSPGVNENGTQILGTAEGGIKITLYQINAFNKKDRELLLRYFHVMHHEFGHIFHQNKPYPSDFKTITQSSYTTSWYNISDQTANEKGYVTAYAMASPDEDFVEIIGMLLTHSNDEWEDFLNSIPKEGRDVIRKKENYVADYFKKSWKIDIYELQELIAKTINQIVTEE